MAYDQELAGRIRAALSFQTGIVEKSMFGGRAFLKDGHLLASASGRGGMLLRVQPEVASALVAEGSASSMMMRGRELPGWLHVELDPADERLAACRDLGLAFVATLESKAVNRLGPDRSRM